MRRFHPSIVGAAILGTASLLAYSAPGSAQSARSVDVYSGEASLGQGIKLGGWGSGTAIEDRAYRTAGETSIRVETNGFYAGGRVEFDAPRDITAAKNDPYGFLEFIIRFQAGKPSTSGSPGFSGGSGGYPGGGGSGGSGGMMRMMQGSRPQGFPGGFGGGDESISPDTKRLKVVLRCEEGEFVATNFPVTLLPAREEGWFSVAIPFVAFKGIKEARTARLKEVRVFGDNKDTFWIGEIRTTTDDEDIDVEPLEDGLEVSVGEPVEFRAAATGGLSPLQYIWDFDRTDGPAQEDAVGPYVVHVFRKASDPVPGKNDGELQPYVVTLTVRDLSGAKKPVRRTTDVVVNP